MSPRAYENRVCLPPSIKNDVIFEIGLDQTFFRCVQGMSTMGPWAVHYGERFHHWKPVVPPIPPPCGLRHNILPPTALGYTRHKEMLKMICHHVII